MRMDATMMWGKLAFLFYQLTSWFGLIRPKDRMQASINQLSINLDLAR